MKIEIREAPEDAPVGRIYIGAVGLRNFRGKPCVDVQLFRPLLSTDEIGPLKGRGLTGQPDAEMPPEVLKNASEEAALACLLEAFTREEAEALAKYFQGRYADQMEYLSVCPMSLPVPLGVWPLGSLPEGKNSGFIHFDRAPGYDLPFQVKGYYDLAE